MDKVFYVTAVRESDWDSGAEMSLYLPATPYELLDGLDQLRLPWGAPALAWVEGTCRFDALSKILTEPCDLCALNALARRLSTLTEAECTAFEGLLALEVQQSGYDMDLRRLLDLACNTDSCHVVGGILNDSQLGRFYGESGFVPGVETLPDHVFELLDFERIGRERRQAEGGVFTPGGYVLRHGPPVRHVPEPSWGDPPEYIFRWENGKCVDCCIPRLTGLITETRDSPVVAGLEEKLFAMNTHERVTYKALLETFNCRDLRQAAELADTINNYLFSPEISSPVEMAKDVLTYTLTEPERLTPYLNLYQYGQALIDETNGVLTPYGLLERRDGQPVLAAEAPKSGMTMR